MSILLKKRLIARDQGVFGVVLGERLAGKSTLAGTLNGKTIMLTAGLFETGSGSAQAKAKELGNHLDVSQFDSITELHEMIAEIADSDYDNVYIDGASGITELLYRSPEIKAALKKNTWDGFRDIADRVEDHMLATKSLASQANKNVFYTMSVAPEMDKMGNVLQLKPEQKGGATVKNMKAIFPVVISIKSRYDDEGNQMDAPELVTKTNGLHSGRLDDLLSEDNPGVVPADLSLIVNLLRGE